MSNDFAKFAQDVQRELSDEEYILQFMSGYELARHVGKTGEEVAHIAQRLRETEARGELQPKYPAPDLEKERRERIAEIERKYQGPMFHTFSVRELLEKDIPPIQWVVEGLLPQGLHILASPPKYGKSWLMLSLCLSVAKGEPFLGYKTRKGGCLYLALEDSPQRLKDRLHKVLHGQSAPETFYCSTSARTLDNGLLEDLDQYLKENPTAALVVIDTFQRVRGAARGGEGVYAGDYREMARLKKFADQRNIAVLLVHHLRKMSDDADPFNRISGSTGILGAADTAIVLTKERREDVSTTMSVVGRDVESNDLVLVFDRERYLWKNLGDVDTYAADQLRREYLTDPVVLTIKKLLESSPDHSWNGNAKQIIDAGFYMTRTKLANSSQALRKKLNDLEPLLLEYDEIIHEQGGNGGGGTRHRFYYLGRRGVSLNQTEIDAVFPPYNKR